MEQKVDAMLSAHQADHGVPMPAELAAEMQEKMQYILRLYEGDARTAANFADRSYWESISCGLHCTGESAVNARAEEWCASDRDFNELGYTIGRRVDNTQSTPDSTPFSAIHQTVLNLQLHGWPPAFILMYDEGWAVIDSMFASCALFLGADCVMEPDPDCWSLRRPAATGEGSEYAGMNFSCPHRDMNFSACHEDGEGGRVSCVTAWAPINPSGATAANGCMRVLPIAQVQ
jgi:hypothetical protein